MATRKKRPAPTKTPSLYTQFIAFDDRLALRGVPPTGAWWRAGLRRWFDAYERGDVLELFACVGRGSAKSTIGYKLAVFFALFGAFDVPIGEVHYAVVISRLKEEAAKGVSIIGQWLRLLGVRHHPAGDAITLDDVPGRGIRVVAASVAGASGWRAFFVFRDERSKWGESGIEERDAEEIDTSASAMTATHPRAPLISMGSAWGAFGGFYDAIMAGDAAGRIVLGPQPTWIATDGRITEAMCRAKEPDERKFEREYLCVFQGAASAALDVAALRECIDDDDFAPGVHAPVIVQDPSGGGGNAHAWCVFQWGTRKSAPLSGAVLRMTYLHAIEDAKAKGLSSDDVADMVAATARAVGAEVVHSDQHAAWTWQSAFGQRGLRFREHPWTSPTKNDAVVRLRELISSRTLSIEPGKETDALIREAGCFEERITPSGNTTFNAARGNDDRVSLLLLVARLDAEVRLAGSPLRAGRRPLIDIFHDDDLTPSERAYAEHVERVGQPVTQTTPEERTHHVVRDARALWEAERRPKLTWTRSGQLVATTTRRRTAY